MKIETKFNIGDGVVFILDGIVKNAKIDSIEIKVKSSITNGIYSRISYDVSYGKNLYGNPIIIGKEEKYLFATKQELLDSL